MDASSHRVRIARPEAPRPLRDASTAPMGKAIPRLIHRHTHPRARPETAPAPAPSGIDYLGLVAERVAAEQARRIAYAALGESEGEGEPPSEAHDDSDDSDDKEERR